MDSNDIDTRLRILSLCDGSLEHAKELYGWVMGNEPAPAAKPEADEGFVREGAGIRYS